MGETQKQQRFLVVMTNKDVYYLTWAAANELMGLISTDNAPPFYRTTDIKSGNSIAIALKNVSSVVMPENGGRNV